ncbi:CehA/McbA family metallohydrolase [Peptococcus simiae]|uniref:CehA/McbA family metallohydrolase n=1 Tax=Peptococcus simiae TaxID=1643805 RepID=UPI003980BAD0
MGQVFKTIQITHAESQVSFDLPVGTVGFRLIFEADRRALMNVFLYDEEDRLRGQLMHFGQDADLWFGPTLALTSPHCLPLVGRTYTLFNPMMDPAEATRFIPFTVTAVAYDDRARYEEDLTRPAEAGEAISWLGEADDAVGASGLDWWADALGHGGWLAGDFHTHTRASDGQSSQADNVQTARRYGLDFFAATDHSVYPTAWVDHEGVLVLPSVEVTTAFGHFNAHFSKGSPYKSRPLGTAGPGEVEVLLHQAVRRQGAKLCLNHPFMAPWRMMLPAIPLETFAYIEIINDPTYKTASKANEKALRAWSALWNGGVDLTGLGGSDAHLPLGDRYPQTRELTRLGNPITWVYAREGSLKALEAGLAAGHTTIARAGRPWLTVTKDAQGQSQASPPALTGRDLAPGVTLCCGLADEPVGVEKDPGRPEPAYHQWMIDGVIAAEREGASSTLVLPEDGHWVRVDWRSAKGELVATTNPVRWQGAEEDRRLHTWNDLEKAMNPPVRGVVFDKDGTLMAFSDLWEKATEAFIERVAGDKAPACRAAVGLVPGGGVMPDSPLASGTLAEIAQALSAHSPVPVSPTDLHDQYKAYMTAHPESIQPLEGLRTLLDHLRDRGIRLAVMTSDDADLTHEALRLLGVDHYFDMVISGDRYPAKPRAAGLMAFRDQAGISLDEMVFVGDSCRDMRLGALCQRCYALSGTVSAEEVLVDLADDLVPNLVALVPLI